MVCIPLRSRDRELLSRQRSFGLLGRRGRGLDRPEKVDISACALWTRACTRIPYNHASIDPHNKVEPRLDGELRVGVAQHLEPKQPLLLLRTGILAVKAGYEAVEGVEHGLRRCRKDVEWRSSSKAIVCPLWRVWCSNV